VPVEGNLVSDFRFLVIDPRVGSMRQNFTFEICFDIFAERHVLAVAQIGIRLRFAFQLPLRRLQDLAGRIPLGPLDRDRPIAEVFILEDPADRYP